MRHRFLRSAIAASILTAGLVAGQAGVSQAATCSSPATRQTFAPWGDYSQYFSMVGGTFESGASGWTFYGSGYGSPSVTGNQEPWRVNGGGHGRGLTLPAYATAMAPYTCVTEYQDAIRFFYKSPGVGGASLLAKIEVNSAAGRTSTQTVIAAGGAGWKVSPKISIPNKLSNGQQHISVTFTPIGTAATWSVDDVMIDPWKTR